jgi:hypothetical protein
LIEILAYPSVFQSVVSTGFDPVILEVGGRHVGLVVTVALYPEHCHFFLSVCLFVCFSVFLTSAQTFLLLIEVELPRLFDDVIVCDLKPEKK